MNCVCSQEAEDGGRVNWPCCVEVAAEPAAQPPGLHRNTCTRYCLNMVFQ